MRALLGNVRCGRSPPPVFGGKCASAYTICEMRNACRIFSRVKPHGGELAAARIPPRQTAPRDPKRKERSRTGKRKQLFNRPPTLRGERFKDVGPQYCTTGFRAGQHLFARSALRRRRAAKPIKHFCDAPGHPHPAHMHRALGLL